MIRLHAHRSRILLGAAFLMIVGEGAPHAFSSTSAAGILLQQAATARQSTSNAAQGTAQAAIVRQRAAEVVAQSASDLQVIRNAQAAARAAALAGMNNLGADPNHPGQNLPDVPNGLGVGGLDVATGTNAGWSGANPLDGSSQTVVNGTTTVTVVQTQQNALLNWQTFNVGKSTTLKFDQSAGGSDVGNWIAFNRVFDPSGRPSQILGQIQAPGQVYVINPNGIIFGGSSQVNAHALIATALPLNTNLVGNLVGNPDLQFLFSGSHIDQGNSTPAFAPDPPVNGFYGNVTVQTGAQLASPATADHVGGRVILIGPNVTNNGTISTPDGQVILAAGLQVGLTAHNTNDPTLAGLDAFVGAVASGGSAATNNGELNAPRGDVMMVSQTVNQNGAITSTTSVSHNGRVDLLADYGTAIIQPVSGSGDSPHYLPTATGTVTLGDDSLTQILPEWSSAETAVGAVLALSSIVDIQGQMIHLGNRSLLWAPSANLPTGKTAFAVGGQALVAGVTLDAGQWLRADSQASTPYQFVHANSQVYLDADATIDVAGSEDVMQSVADNVVAVKLLGAELADSPLQRDGILDGQTVYVDIRQHGAWDPTLNNGAGGYVWVGTPVGDTSGTIAGQLRTVSEMTTAGGSVEIQAGSSVVMKSGSSIDVSGGWTDFTGGYINTTVFISNGVAYSAAGADPNLVYSGIQTGSGGVGAGSYYDPGYIQGSSGGSLGIVAPSMALDGDLYGNIIVGPRQLSASPNSQSLLPTVLSLSRPSYSSLTLAFQREDPSLSPSNGAPAFSIIGPETAPTVIFQNGGSLPAVAAFDPLNSDLSLDRQSQVDLSPSLLADGGFGNLSVKNGIGIRNSGDTSLDPVGTGDILVAAGTNLTAPVGGSITLAGMRVEIDGNMSAPSGSLNFTAYDISPYQFVNPNASTPSYDPTRGKFTLGAGASLSTAGATLDERFSPDWFQVANGGSISIAASQVDLSQGLSVDASGGAWISPTGAVTYGNGGSISIKAGKDAQYAVVGGRLLLGARLTAYSGLASGAGSLALQAPLIQIGGTAPLDADTLWVHDVDADGSISFFNQGGFGSFSLTGFGKSDGAGGFLTAVDIADHTLIAPRVQLRQLLVNASGYSWLAPTSLVEGLRGSANLSFIAAGIKDPLAGLIVRGDLVVGEGASIVTDPQTDSSHGVSLKASSGTVSVLGSIRAAGGTIAISGASNSADILFADNSEALATVYLGADSVLSTAGVFQASPIPNSQGYRTGTVFGGGTVDISGNIAAAEGSKIDVSGASAILDVSSVAAGKPNLAASILGRWTPSRVDSNGGAIILSGGQALYSRATLLGAAGGPSALGGTLNVSSGNFYLPGVTPLPQDITLDVVQSLAALPSGSLGTGLALPTGEAQGNSVGGLFAVESFADRTDASGRLTNGGFDTLGLGGNVQFLGDIVIQARRQISAASGGFLYGDGSASTIALTAPYVALGQAFAGPQTALEEQQDGYLLASNPYYIQPTHGNGHLRVTASSLIDVGNLSLQNIGDVVLIADTGDIRGDGTLDVEGSITLRAGQIYPTTESYFNIVAYDYAGGTGSISIDPSATGTVRGLPLSAGGTLNLLASTIVQNGTLRAPIGTINIGWNGMGSSPIDPVTGAGISGTSVVPITQSLILGSQSITSVSAIDPVTGQPVVIPYGIEENGVNWIDPAGQDITSGANAPAKAINLSATTIDDQQGAKIDIGGGGDLYAYQWVQGNGGSKDILSGATSYAILPGYTANYVPADGQGAESYGNGSTLGVGASIYLSGSSGLPAGYYTLLPARYALLPGAYLVTPQSTTATSATLTKTDGSTLVSGYRVNTLSPTVASVYSTFELAPASVVRARAEYSDFYANTTFPANAEKNSTATPRLPNDAGQLVFNATGSMSIEGRLLAQAANGGRGGQVDIGSTSDIFINAEGALPPGASGLVLKISDLDSFGDVSLLVGGVRSYSSSGTVVSVGTGSITIDTSGGPALTGADLLFASNGGITVADDSRIAASGTIDAETLLVQNAVKNGDGTADGNGALLRVGSDASAGIERIGTIAYGGAPSISLGNDVSLSGNGIIVDSTSQTSFSSTTKLQGKSVSLNSGQLSLQVDDPGALQTTGSLILSNDTLQTLAQNAESLSLLSYSSIDIYGHGEIGSLDGAGNPTLRNISLHAGEIRGFNGADGVTLNAGSIEIDNSPGVAAPGAIAAGDGTLVLNAGTIVLGNNSLAIDQYADVLIQASKAIVVSGVPQASSNATPDSLLAPSLLSVAGNLTLSAPVVTGTTGAAQIVSATGTLAVQGTGPIDSTLTGGLGSKLTLQGASVSSDGTIRMIGGDLTLHATQGDVTVGGTLDVSGQSEAYYDKIALVDGGSVTLASDNGSVVVGSTGTVDVSGPSGGQAGTLSVSAPKGTFVADGALKGAGGKLKLDLATLNASGTVNNLAALARKTADFTASQAIRIRGDGTANDVGIDASTVIRTGNFSLSADRGSILDAGTIDASGATGGSITLDANGSLTVAGTAVLDASGADYDAAGKGGSITLAAGSETNGIVRSDAVLDIQGGSRLNLQVAAAPILGQFGGTLHLRAPRTSSGTDLQINAVNGAILGASSIVAEGYKLYDLTSSGGTITTALQSTISADGESFSGSAGTTTTGYTTMFDRLFGSASQAVQNVANIEAGVEIVNRNGDLTLSNDWNLVSLRNGPNSAPGILTLRASGNLVFNGSLSDGFMATAPLYQAKVDTKVYPSSLPLNNRSWSYDLAAGADFAGADFHDLLPLSSLNGGGNLELGVAITDNNGNASVSDGQLAQTSTAVAGHYQVIRTGTGDIDIATGGDVQLLNVFATIYTAGALAPDQNLGATFVVPTLSTTSSSNTLGSLQPIYSPQYTLAGGDVTLDAQGSIEHLTSPNGVLVDDSVKQLPINWLYRRGYVDSTGTFATTKTGTTRTSQTIDTSASTTWWVDFSNFFEGVGTLGGGNVALTAGQNISNVDAVVATNARMPGLNAAGQNIAPNASSLVELGGGDLTVIAGNNINGGVYYVERGAGTLQAGYQIVTNETRSPSMQTVNNPKDIASPYAWLPTTLFLGGSDGGDGSASFTVSSWGDLLLGPVANPFLLPEGLGNTFWDKTYFSTYSTADSVAVASLTGDVTLRTEATTTVNTGVNPLLYLWLQYVLFDTYAMGQPTLQTLAVTQPWLRINETDVTLFTTGTALMPGNLKVVAYSGDINLQGSLTLSPSPTGQLELISAGSLNGLQQIGVNVGPSGDANSRINIFASSTINLSDANPAQIPGIASPYAYASVLASLGTSLTSGNLSVTSIDVGLFGALKNLLTDDGSITGSNTTLLTLRHALINSGPLHADDDDPVRLYALDGDISGLTLFAGKSTDVLASRDISDISLYIENNHADDVSIISAGRDILPYDASAPLLVHAQQINVQPDEPGNTLIFGDGPEAGDIQIGGPGTLEVLAGRNLNLGTQPPSADGTGLGITSIGNSRNPSLPFAGADIVAGAGIGFGGASMGQLDFATFEAQFLDPATGGLQAARYLPVLADWMGVSGDDTAVWGAFQAKPKATRDQLALDIFYLALRDAGRDHNDPDSAGYGNYEMGYAAIAALFPGSGAAGSPWSGDITLTAREIKTKNGGDINLLAPGGQVLVGFQVNGTQPIDQGILTEYGGSISIFADQSVLLGTSRVFTLRGGDEILWSSNGDLNAGASSTTVQSAPPTRVLIDPESGDVRVDLAGIATGGGIGALESVVGVPPADIDLIAPRGTVDAGDAGIRVSGNLNIAALQVRNTANITVAGKSTGVPTVTAPNIAAVTAAASASAGASSSSQDAAKQARDQAAGQAPIELPSVITVEILGYGGGDSAANTSGGTGEGAL